MPGIESAALLNYLHEHVLANVHGLILILEEVPTAPQDHRSVALTERFHVQRVIHHAVH